MPETLPVKLVVPATEGALPGAATEDGVEYMPSEMCQACYAIVPQAKADEHMATHPPEVNPT